MASPPDTPPSTVVPGRPVAAAVGSFVRSLLAGACGFVGGWVATGAGILLATAPMQFGMQLDHEPSTAEKVGFLLFWAAWPVGALVAGRALRRIGSALVGLLVGFAALWLWMLAALQGIWLLP